MIKKLLFVGFLLLSLQLHAQQEEGKIPLKFNISEVFKESRKKLSAPITFEDGAGGIYVGRHHKKGFYLEHFDVDAKLSNSYEFELVHKKSRIKGGVLSGNTISLIEMYYNKKEKVLQYYVNKSAKNKLSFSRELLFSVPFEEVNTKDFDFMGLPGQKDGDMMGSFTFSKNKNHSFLC